MKALGSINWKRWVATLCVALIAFVTIERTTCVDSCAVDTAGGSYNIASVMLSDDSASGDQPDAPAKPSAHHCCAAHCAAMPVFAAATQPDPQSCAGAVMVDTRAPSTTQDGPERPPRVTVIA